MSSNRLGFIDSTLRDAIESLFGGRLRTELIAQILEDFDCVGFHSIEAWGGGTFQSSLGRLHEDPWDRLRVLKKKLKQTPLQMLIRGRFLVGDRPFTYGFVERFLSHAADLGVDVVRLVDPLNDLVSLTRVAHLARKAGLNVQLSILCSDSTDNLSYYEQLIGKSDLSDADALGIFNPWGTLSPSTAAKVVELLHGVRKSGVFAHVHNLKGAGPTHSLTTLKNGFSFVDTCFSAFSCDGSLPSIESFFSSSDSNVVTRNFDLDLLVKISDALMRLRNEYFDRLPAITQPTAPIDQSLQEIAPTFLTILAQRLAPERSLDNTRLRDEVRRIMNEVGLPALVSPISETIVRQAVLNLHSKARYSEFTEEFLGLLRGELGGIRPQKGLFQRLGTNLDLGTALNSEEIQENISMPPESSKASDGDLLCFALYPHEFTEMKAASPYDTVNGKQKIVAAAMALLAQETPIGRTFEREQHSVKLPENSTRWRNALQLDNSNSERKRGFVQEPF